MICISTDDLKKIKNKIMISGGPHKVEAILGAARAGLVDTLITDSISVNKIADMLNIK
jgi:DNA-binding transcriptional regulator LsrR (DeoR family)